MEKYPHTALMNYLLTIAEATEVLVVQVLLMLDSLEDYKKSIIIY